MITEIADFAFSFLETVSEIASVEDVISWSRPENAATIPLIYAHPRPSTLFPNVTTVGRGFLMGFGGETLDIEELFGTSGVLTNVDEMFLSNSLVRRVRIGAAFRNLTSFPLSFLAGCSRLTTVDWSAAELSNITEISRCFCMGTALESFTFPKSLSNVRSIGELFLARCKHLTVVDMRAVAPVVTSLGACFLQGCVKLRMLLIFPSMSASPSSSAIPTIDGFPWSFPSLEILSPSALDACGSLCCDVSVPFNVGALLDTFPTGAFRSAGFTSITLDGDGAPRALRDFVAIGDRVLRDCESLASILLCSLPKLHTIGSEFAACCGHLTHVTMRGLPTLTSIGDHFLERCESLLELDFRGIGCCRLTCIGNRFLSGCTSLTTVLGLSELLINVHRIGSAFMTHCRSISSLNLSSCFQQVVSIGDYFLGSCLGLKELTLFNEPTASYALDSIPKYFLSDCASLSVINPQLAPRNQIFPEAHHHRVRMVGCFFMHGCRSLEAVDLSGMLRLRSCNDTLLTGLEEGFLSDCIALKVVTLNPSDDGDGDVGDADQLALFDSSEDGLHFSNCAFLRSRPSQFQPPGNSNLHHCSCTDGHLHLQIPVVFLAAFNPSPNVPD